MTPPLALVRVHHGVTHGLDHGETLDLDKVVLVRLAAGTQQQVSRDDSRKAVSKRQKDEMGTKILTAPCGGER